MTARAIVAGSLLLAAPSLALAQVVERYSVSSAGAQGDDMSGSGFTTPDGRFASFASNATNLVANDNNAVWDVFLRDRFAATTERVSVDSFGAEGNADSTGGALTPDARFVAFWSNATNLVAGDANGVRDVFVRDRALGATALVSVDSTGAQGNGPSFWVAISADGRFVAFGSFANNLVPGDTNGGSDVFVRDLVAGTTELVSVDPTGAYGNAPSYLDGMTPDGRFVVFSSAASNFVSGDTNAAMDVFLRDRQSGTTERISVDSAGGEGHDHSLNGAVTPDGRFIAFDSVADNLVAGDTNQRGDVFVRDRQNGTTERVSLRSNGHQGNGTSWYPAISADGSLVAFRSFATNLVGFDHNGSQDAFVHDRTTGATRRVSLDATGHELDQDTQAVTISADGRFVTITTSATNVVPGDTNGVLDAFLIGPFLQLSAAPLAPTPGATLSLDTWTGLANGAALIVVTDVNGAPMFLPAVLGTFDAAGRWAYSTVVPNGLSGNVVTVETFGIAPDGKVAATNGIALAFQ